MDKFLSFFSNYAQKFSNELGDIAGRLDGSGWAAISALLVVCGWFFLKGNKIKST